MFFRKIKVLSSIFLLIPFLFLLIYPTSGFAADESKPEIFIQASSNVTPGETFTVSFQVMNIQDLYSFSLQVKWDATQADLLLDQGKPFTAGSFLGGTVLINEVGSEAGTAKFIETSLGNIPGKSGSGLMASLKLKAKESASGRLTIQLDEKNTTLVSSGATKITYTTKEAVVLVTNSGNGGGGGYPASQTGNQETKETPLGQLITTKDDRGNLTAQLQLASQVITNQVNDANRPEVLLQLGNEVLIPGVDLTVNLDPKSAEMMINAGKPLHLQADSFTLKIPVDLLSQWMKSGSLQITIKMEEGKAGEITIAEETETAFVSPIITVGKAGEVADNPFQLTLKPDSTKVTDTRYVGGYMKGVDGKWQAVTTPLSSNGKEMRMVTDRFGTFAAIQYVKHFADVENHWAKTSIEVLASQHLLKGKSETRFAPAQQVTRAEFTAMLVRLLGLKTEAYQGSFQDVRDTDWYAQEVETAKKAGLITGYQGKFNPQANISRQDMLLMLYRAVAHTEKKFSPIEPNALHSFRDWQKIAPYARDAVAVGVTNKLVNGMPDGTFHPLGEATRAQAAKILYQFIYEMESR